MNVLEPITVTNAILYNSTIAEPAAGETEWSGATVAYVVGNLRIRATTHRVYECLVNHTSAASPLPEDNPTQWKDVAPTSKWAPFDVYTNTAATTTTSMSYVLLPGFFNALALYGLAGNDITITLKDAPGGSVVYSYEGSLSEDPLGWYEYLFSPLKPKSRLLLTALPLSYTAELTITVTGGAVSIGMLNVGDYISLFGGTGGGTQYGVSAEPISQSYVKADSSGVATIVRRAATTGMRATVTMPQEQADIALEVIQRVLDTPVSWVAIDAVGYTGLNVFGLGSGSVVYDSPSHALLNLNVKGII